MFRKLAAVALLGSLVMLAVAGIDDVRGLLNKDLDSRYVVKKVRWERDHTDRAGSRGRNIEELAGAWEFVHAGDVFGKFPWSAHVVLTLKPTGRFLLDLDITVDGDHEVETIEGEYRLAGDRIILTSSEGDADGRLEEHALRIEGDRLIPDVGWPARAALGVAGVGELAFSRLN